MKHTSRLRCENQGQCLAGETTLPPGLPNVSDKDSVVDIARKNGGSHFNHCNDCATVALDFVNYIAALRSSLCMSIYGQELTVSRIETLLIITTRTKFCRATTMSFCASAR